VVCFKSVSKAASVKTIKEITQRAALVLALALIGCMSAAAGEPTGKTSSASTAMCDIAMVWTNLPEANFSYGHYKEVCPTLNAGLNNLSPAFGCGGEGPSRVWCWQYAASAWCCAASASSKGLCDTYVSHERK
jgi:hypothetical protein